MYNNVPLLFLIDQLILEASAEIIQKIVGYFKELKARKIAFEIFWPLTIPDIESTDPSNPKDISVILATEVAEGPKIWGANYK